MRMTDFEQSLYKITILLIFNKFNLEQQKL